MPIVCLIYSTDTGMYSSSATAIRQAKQLRVVVDLMPGKFGPENMTAIKLFNMLS